MCLKINLNHLILLGTLKTIVDLCVVDASVRDICTKGDALLLEETGKVSIFNL